MKSIICIASGPSLTADDCAMAACSGHETIAVNTSWELAPSCDHIYAADFAWWEKYEAWIGIDAQRWTQSKRARSRYGIQLFKPDAGGPFNSGQRAIELAAHLGAKRIILLGYDCTLSNGTHWHGEHPATLRNPEQEEVTRWHADFSALNEKLPGIEIINASRVTALTCFPRATLEQALSLKSTDRD